MDKLKSIKILAKNYKVELKPLEELLETSDNEHPEYVYGLCDYLQHKIQLNEELLKQDLRITLLHEVLHAIYEQYGDDDLGSDELHIQKLSTALAQVLIDNYEFRELFEGE